MRRGRYDAGWYCVREVTTGLSMDELEQARLARSHRNDENQAGDASMQ